MKLEGIDKGNMGGGNPDYGERADKTTPDAVSDPAKPATESPGVIIGRPGSPLVGKSDLGSTTPGRFGTEPSTTDRIPTGDGRHQIGKVVGRDKWVFFSDPEATIGQEPQTQTETPDSTSSDQITAQQELERVEERFGTLHSRRYMSPRERFGFNFAIDAIVSIEGSLPEAERAEFIKEVKSRIAAEIPDDDRSGHSPEAQAIKYLTTTGRLYGEWTSGEWSATKSGKAVKQPAEENQDELTPGHPKVIAVAKEIERVHAEEVLSRRDARDAADPVEVTRESDATVTDISTRRNRNTAPKDDKK